MRAARDVRVTLGVGVVLLLAIGAFVLTRAPPRVVRVGERNTGTGLLIAGGAEVCQANEILPAGVSAIRLSLLTYFGPAVRVRASVGSSLLTQGKRGPGWTGTAVTVPVAPVSRSVSHVRLCIGVRPNSELIGFTGVPTSRRHAAVLNGEPMNVRVGVEYLAAGRGSWWSRVLAVARHIGVGHALSGTWVTLLIAALVAGVGALSARLLLRELPATAAVSRPLVAIPSPPVSVPHPPVAIPSPPVSVPHPPATVPRQPMAGLDVSSAPRRPWPAVTAMLRRVPRAAWMCALIAFLNASAWSLVVPPFQGRDEVDHFAYVEQLVENGALPENGQENGTYSPEETLVLRGLHYKRVVHAPDVPAISSVAEQRALTKDVGAGASLRGSGEAGVATSEPPLYYALQAIPYVVGRGNVLVQLQLMRLSGAMFGALTALFAFLFLREALPRAPWAATVGALCVALQPLFAFMSGSVNPDAMLLALAAAIFLCLARAFRRGLSRRLALVLGFLIAAGFLTKLNFIGLAFGVFVGLGVLGAGARKSRGREALVSAAIAAGIGASPAILYVLRNLLSSHAALGSASQGSVLVSADSIFRELSYIWELYLPRLPGMTRYFDGLATYKDIWFDRSVGLYGWMDTMFPTWVENLALAPVGALVLLCGRELVARGDALRARLPELGVYATMTAGVLVLVGASSYLSDIVSRGPAFGEPRYLLPLLPLLGAAIALAVRGAGRRWTYVTGAAVAILFFAHDLFSQLQVVARYYG
jgi:hypothetical protein